MCAHTDAQVASRVSVTSRGSVGAGSIQANGHSRASALSKTGRFVAFESQATNLVPSVTNTCALDARGTVTEQPAARWEGTHCGRSLAAAFRSPFISGRGHSDARWANVRCEMKNMRALRSLLLVAPFSVAVLAFLPTPAAADGGGLGGAMANCLADIAAYEYWSAQCIIEYPWGFWIDAQACANADDAKASMQKSCGAY